jgi:hypothetical protein
LALFGKLFKKKADKSDGGEETFAAPEPVVLKPGPFNLNDTLRDVANILSLDAQEKRISIVYRMKKNVPSQVIGDRYKLSRLLTDLIGNAIDYTDKREDVVVQISRNENNEESLELHFEVIDYGIGVEEKAVAEVLMPMLTSDRPAAAFGIKGSGLQRARDIIHAMQGSIQVKSTPKKGSRFVFHIQIGAPDLKEKRHYRLPNTDGVGRKTLVVDNDMGSAKAVAPMLEYFRHDVTIGTLDDLAEIASYDIVMFSSEYWSDALRQRIEQLGDQRPKVVMIESMIQHHEIEENALDFADWLIYKPFTQQFVFEMLTALYSDALHNAPETEEAVKETAPRRDGIHETSVCVEAFLNGTVMEHGHEEGKETASVCGRHAHQFFVATEGLQRHGNDYSDFVERLKELIWKYVKADRVVGGMIDQGNLEDAAAFCAQMKEVAEDLGVYKLACMGHLLETACREGHVKDIEALKKTLTFVVTQTVSSLDQFIDQAKYKIR